MNAPDPAPDQVPQAMHHAAVPASASRGRWIIGCAAVMTLLIVLGIATVLFIAMRAADAAGSILGVQKAQRAVVEILRSEEMLFLVTDRVVTRVDVEVNERSLWAGGRQGLLLATVRLYVGIDLQKITEKSVKAEGETVVVDVPRPSVLDFSIDPDWRYFDKRTGVWVLADWVTGRNVESELRVQLRARTMEFVRQQKLMPDEERTLERLNRYAAGLWPRVGKRVEFRYRLRD